VSKWLARQRSGHLFCIFWLAYVMFYAIVITASEFGVAALIRGHRIVLPPAYVPPLIVVGGAVGAALWVRRIRRQAGDASGGTES